MDSPDIIQDSPRKRQKLSPSIEKSVSIQVPSADTDDHTVQVEKGSLHATAGDDAPLSSEENRLAQDPGKLQEVEVGITEYVSTRTLRFSGILKKRYTDFLVNEILPSGEVLHLTDLGVPPKAQQTRGGKHTESSPPDPGLGTLGEVGACETNQDRDDAHPPDRGCQVEESSSALKTESFQLSPDDTAELSSFVSQDILQSILALYRKVIESSSNTKWKSLGSVTLPATTDRECRTAIHKSIRRIFSSRLESSTDDNGIIVISASPFRGKQRKNDSRHGKGHGRPQWDELGGEYLHFTLYKENKDSMEVISFLARQLKLAAKSFQFAGTKDRRGVTVQRASAYRIFAERLAGLNRILKAAKLGGFLYQPSGLTLGDLAGNEFVITLRDCSFPSVSSISATESVKLASEKVGEAIERINKDGFINYYGLQRFGVFSARTDMIGMKMLKGDLEGACQAILSYNPIILAAAQDSSSAVMISSDDKARAKALHLFQTTGNVNLALRDMPKKFSAETALIRHLGGSGRSRDFQGALQTLPRNLRLIYVHAYQSLVWNYCVGERWKRFGDKVVEGDLVLVSGGDNQVVAGEVGEEMDDHDEVIIKPGTGDPASKLDDKFQRARALSKDEAESGKYSIFDIVLPTPGFDIVYPRNSMASFYKEFMGSERGGGLDPYDMRRKWRDISLSGSYRNILARPLGDGATFEIREYKQDDEQMVETDLEKLQNTRKLDEPGRRPQDESNEAKSEMDHPNEEAVNKLAVILKMQLGASQYATMALRELMGPGGVKPYTPDYGGGR